MAERYHVNKNGIPGICQASSGRCPFGSDKDHYESPKEAVAAFEEKLDEVSIPPPFRKRTADATGDSHNDINSIPWQTFSSWIAARPKTLYTRHAGRMNPHNGDGDENLTIEEKMMHNYHSAFGKTKVNSGELKTIADDVAHDLSSEEYNVTGAERRFLDTYNSWIKIS
jgi:hypothetical protein